MNLSQRVYFIIRVNFPLKQKPTILMRIWIRFAYLSNPIVKNELRAYKRLFLLMRSNHQEMN